MITIYHNPRCSKSRETLALVEEIATQKQQELQVVDYQKAPLDQTQLRAVVKQLGVAVRDIVRSNEDEYTQLKLEQADDQALLAALAAHPKLLQRPIVVFGGKARIGRPPENVLELFGG
jgi:arsenate reductase